MCSLCALTLSIHIFPPHHTIGQSHCSSRACLMSSFSPLFHRRLCFSVSLQFSTQLLLDRRGVQSLSALTTNSTFSHTHTFNHYGVRFFESSPSPTVLPAPIFLRTFNYPDRTFQNRVDYPCLDYGYALFPWICRCFICHGHLAARNGRVPARFSSQHLLRTRAICWSTMADATTISGLLPFPRSGC